MNENNIVIAFESAVELIKMSLMLNPDNKNLTSEELDRLALEDFKSSMDDQ